MRNTEKRPSATIPLLILAASLASAHSIWIERVQGGLAVRFGEVEDGVRDTLAPRQSWDIARTSCATGGPVPVAVPGVDLVSLRGECSAPLVVHGDMPVHGEAKDAGRAIFSARFAPDSGLALPIEPSLVLDLLPVPGLPGAVRVLRGGRPAPGQKVSVTGPEVGTRELVADSGGVVRFDVAHPGIRHFSAWIEEAKSGVHGGARYAKVWHVASISLERR